VTDRKAFRRDLALRACALLAAVLILSGCGDPFTFTSPGPSTAQLRTPRPASSPSPALVVSGPDAEHYTADLEHPLVVRIDGDAVIWLPAHVVQPDGTATVRYAFLPIDCPEAGQVILTIDAPTSHDPWEKSMTDDQMDSESWPAPTDAVCEDGATTSTYLDVQYRPIEDDVPIMISAHTMFQGEPVAPTTMSVVPIYTNLDFERPAFTEASRIKMDKVKGTEKARSAKPRLLASYEFGVAMLPDGTTATHWTSALTGCAYDGAHPDQFSYVEVQVGDGDMAEIGECRTGGMATAQQVFEMPSAGTKISVFTIGGTTWSRIRVSEFQWRSVADE
jgi:hypothetical protein